MKRLIGFIAISGMLIAPNLDSCLYVNEEWHNQHPAKVNEHHSPVPEHNIAAPTDEGSAIREIKDTYSQEDHSDRASEGNNQVKTDQPLEEHLEEMVECDDSAMGDDEYPTLPCDKALHYNTRDGFSPGQKLSREDVFGPDGQTGENHYAIKNTSGMIYKTDQLTCNTPFEHPTTGYSSGDPDKSKDHNYVINDAGELSTNTEDKYCFYLLIPGNGQSDGKIARVDEKDSNSLMEIRNGGVPYLRLNDEYKGKLEAESGDFSFVQGRYITPMPKGKMLLPTNGNQMLFNRTTVYRPYMQDVKRREAGGAAELQDLNQMDTTFAPAKEGGEKSEFFEISGIGSRMTGLNHKTSLVTQPSSNTEGQKISDWPDSFVGSPYLAVGPSGDPSKRLNVALHFPNNETEAEYLEKVTDGSFEPNESRDKIPDGRGHELLNLEQRQDMLSDAVKFQLQVANNYIEEDGESTFDPNLLEDSPVINCDEADDQTKVFCAKYQPLRDNLVAVYNQLGIDNGPGASDALEMALLTKELDTTISVGNLEWQVSSARKAIGNFENQNQTLLDDLDYTIDGSDGKEFPPGFGNYINKTIEGISQKTMLIRLQLSWMVDAERLSQKNLIERDEHATFQELVDGVDARTLSVDDLKTAMSNIATTRYQLFEQDNVTQGAFLHYTAQDNKGRQLLTKLGLIQRGTTQPDEQLIKWKPYIPEELFARCGETTTIEDCRSILEGSEVAPVTTDEIYKSRFDPQGAPLPIEFMPN